MLLQARVKPFALVLCLAISGNAHAQSPPTPPRALTPSHELVPAPAEHSDPADPITPAKVDEAVWEYAKTHDVVPVFIALRHQPQSEILLKWEGVYAFRTEMARTHHKWAHDRAAAFPDELQAAQKELEAVTMDVRRHAITEIQDAIRPWLDDVESTLLSLGATNVTRYKVISMFSARVPAEAVQHLEADDRIATVALVRQGTMALNQSVPAFGAPVFWAGGFTGAGVPVALLDSGVRSNHPAFGGRISPISLIYSNALSCIGGDNFLSPEDFQGHGTHVAAIIAAQSVPAVPGYIGVAPAATIYNLKIGCNVGPGLPAYNNDDLVRAIEAALIGTPVRIFNLSIGTRFAPEDTFVNTVIDRLAHEYDASFSVCAGNDGEQGLKSLWSPGNAYNVISVANAARAGTAVYNTIHPTSSRGPTLQGRRKPDIAAPGTDIYSAAYDWDFFLGLSPDYVSKTGTSMAAPHITGAIALLRQAGVANALAIKALLLNTTDNFGWEADRGWGYGNLTRTFQQRTQYVTGIVTPRSGTAPVRFYTGTANGPFSATLVWNRRSVSAQSVLNDLNLAMFDAATNTRLNSSTSLIDNVEQVATPATTNAVIKVYSEGAFGGGITSEPFAVAFGNGTFSLRAGPELNVSCSAPTTVAPGATFIVSCTARNNGDLDAFGVVGSLNFTGNTGGGINDFGKLGANGGSATRTWNVAAPSALGPFQMAAAIGSVSYGETYLTSANLTLSSTNSLCTITLGGTAQSISSASASGSLSISATSSNCGWTATSNAGWLTITGGASGTGNGAVNYSVTANTSSSPRTAVITVAGATFTITQNGTGTAPVGTRFTPVTPCRVLDTRLPNGAFGGPFITGGGTRSFMVPSSPCSVPGTALAYSVNITVVPRAGSLGYLTIWPTGQAQPFVSTLNSVDGRIVANAAIVPAGTNGAISVFATNDTDVIIDINGYFSSGTGLAFYPVTPCRVADTRNAASALGGPLVDAGQTRSFPVPTSACNIPTSARAYSMNFTVVPSAGLGYLSTWPTGQVQPLVSTLNLPEGGIVANAAIVPAGTNGAISVFATDKTEIIIDINGYFADPGAAGALSFYPATPCRISDTRNPNGALGGPSMAGGSTRILRVPSAPCGVPASAKAYSTNFTVVPNGPLGYLSTWPTGVAQPLVSTLNSSKGKVLANAAIVPSGTEGAVSVFVTNTADVIVDLNGYFAP